MADPDESKPPVRGFESLAKRIQIEQSPGLEQTMARLNEKLKPSPALVKLAESFERENENVRSMFSHHPALDAAADAAAASATVSSIVNSDLRKLTLEAAGNSPEARTARAAEEMRGHMQALAEAAIRADERADEAEARENRMLRWTITAAIAGIVGILVSIAVAIIR